MGVQALFSRAALEQVTEAMKARLATYLELLVRIHFIIEMIRWTGLASWEFEFSFPGSLTSTFLQPR